jgi:hypothetical protein
VRSATVSDPHGNYTIQVVGAGVWVNVRISVAEGDGLRIADGSEFLPGRVNIFSYFCGP